MIRIDCERFAMRENRQRLLVGREQNVPIICSSL
jgi:hypothetical protein